MRYFFQNLRSRNAILFYYGWNIRTIQPPIAILLQRVTVGNYNGGNLSVLSAMVDGSLGTPKTINHTGSGVVKNRQEKPHVHASVFSEDNKYLFVPDLGTDKVVVYTFNPGSGKLAESTAIRTEPGTGPRHGQAGRWTALVVGHNLLLQ